MTSLESLNLQENSMGDDGAAAIAISSSLSNLEELNIAYNQIAGDDIALTP